MRLKELREQGKKSQQEMAVCFGVSLRTWGYWESGEREPKFEYLIKLADYYGVTIDYLVGRIPNVDDYTVNEEAMIAEFQKMSLEQQKEAIAYAKFLQKK